MLRNKVSRSESIIINYNYQFIYEERVKKLLIPNYDLLYLLERSHILITKSKELATLKLYECGKTYDPR